MIHDINATDIDYQLNAIVEYYFENNTQVLGPFRIDRGTGQVTLLRVLDREEQGRYEVSLSFPALPIII